MNNNPAKTQPWKAAWPPVEKKDDATCEGIEYGVAKGATVVVDGTAANVKPKAQPWKASWPPAETEAARDTSEQAGTVQYGVPKGEVAVVDGTAANVKPAKKTDSTNA